MRMQPEGYGAAIYIFGAFGPYRIFVSPVSSLAVLRGPPLLSPSLVLYKIVPVEAEDKEAHRIVSQKDWTNNKIGYDWLINVYNPISKARCSGESHLLILDGHVLHINN